MQNLWRTVLIGWTIVMGTATVFGMWWTFSDRLVPRAGRQRISIRQDSVTAHRTRPRPRLLYRRSGRGPLGGGFGYGK